MIALTVRAVSITLALALCGVSIALNARFGWTLGPTEFDRQLYAGGAGVADAMKAGLAIAVAYAWSQRQFMRALIGSMMLVCFVALSLTSSIGFAAMARDHLQSVRKSAGMKLADVRADLDRKRWERTALPKHRPTATVQADIKSRKFNRRWDSSKRCTDATASKSRSLCADIDRLRAELAAAKRAVVLDSEIAALSARIANTGTKAVGLIDPQTQAISDITTIPIERIGPMLAALIAATIELGSSFGMFVLVGNPAAQVRAVVRTEQELEAEAEPDLKLQAADDAPETGSVCPVCDWAAEALLHRPGARAAAGELFAAYEAHCAESGGTPITQTAFGRALSDIGYAKARAGGRVCYQDVILRPVSVPATATA